MELAKSFRPKRPEMKVLYIPGHVVDIDLQLVVWEYLAVFQPKPFRPKCLLQKILNLIDPDGYDEE